MRPLPRRRKGRHHKRPVETARIEANKILRAYGDDIVAEYLFQKHSWLKAIIEPDKFVWCPPSKTFQHVGGREVRRHNAVCAFCDKAPYVRDMPEGPWHESDDEHYRDYRWTLEGHWIITRMRFLKAHFLIRGWLKRFVSHKRRYRADSLAYLIAANYPAFDVLGRHIVPLDFIVCLLCNKYGIVNEIEDGYLRDFLWIHPQDALFRVNDRVRLLLKSGEWDQVKQAMIAGEFEEEPEWLKSGWEPASVLQTPGNTGRIELIASSTGRKSPKTTTRP